MTNQDTAFAGGNGGATFDPIYDAYQAAPIPDATETEDALPRGIYLVEFEGGKGSFTKEENLPQIRVGAKVVQGLDGTVGRKAFGNLKYATSRFGFKPNEQGVKHKVELTREQWLAEGKEDVETLKRVATVLGLLQPLPSRSTTNPQTGLPMSTVEDLGAFGVQFAGKRAVVEIGVMPGRDDYGPSNFFLWGTIRALDEIVRTKQGEIVGTAVEYLGKKLAAAAAKAAKKAGKVTGASVTAPAASASDFS